MSQTRAWRHALLGIVVFSHLGGQEAQPIGGPKAKDSLETALSATVEGAALRPQKSFLSPQAIESVERDRIAASGAFRIADLLKLMSNVQVWEGDTTVTRVSVRGGVGGTVPRTVQILVDGVPLFNPGQGAADLDALPIPVEAIEKIEVVRGPSSSLYGANAQQGVILITTRRAKEGWSGSARVGAAENGTFHNQGFFSLGAGDLDLAGGFGASSVRAWSDPFRDIRGDHLLYPDNRAHGHAFFIRPELRIGTGSLWAMVAHGWKTGNPERAEGGAPDFPGLYRISRQSYAETLAQLGWKQDWSPALRSEMKFYRINERLGVGEVQVLPDSPISPVVVDALLAMDPAFGAPHNPVDYTGTGGSLQINLDPTEGLHFVFGADGCVSTVEESLLLGFKGRQRETSAGAFGSVDWDLGVFTLSGSLRAANETLGGSTLSPRLALVVPLTEGSVLRAGWFTSTRSPQIYEKRAAYDAPIFPYTQVGNPGLGPEKAKSFEVGWRQVIGRWVSSLTMFRTAYRDLIVSEIVPAVPKALSDYTNAPDGGVNTGIEMALRSEVLPGWSFGTTATFMDFKNPATGSQTYFVPRIQAVGWSQWRWGLWEAYFGAKYLGRYTRWGTDNGVIEAQSRPTVILDFNLAFVPRKGLRVSAYGVNAAHRSTPMANEGTVNGTLVRYARRELGIQAGVRF